MATESLLGAIDYEGLATSDGQERTQAPRAWTVLTLWVWMNELTRDRMDSESPGDCWLTAVGQTRPSLLFPVRQKRPGIRGTC